MSQADNPRPERPRGGRAEAGPVRPPDPPPAEEAVVHVDELHAIRVLRQESFRELLILHEAGDAAFHQEVATYRHLLEAERLLEAAKPRVPRPTVKTRQERHRERKPSL